jgi:hypothetical protein
MRVPLAILIVLTSATARAEPDFSGTWVLTRGGKLMPPQLTSRGLAFKESYDFKNDDPSLLCIPAGWSRVFSNPNTPFEIIQNEDSIRIRHELFDVDRTVSLATEDADLEHRQGDSTYATLGDSIAWYDGDDLLVHSTNFGNHERVLSTIRNWAGMPQSPLMVTLERYHREGDTLDLEIIHFDPIMYSEPLIARHRFVIEQDYEVLPYDCDTEAAVIVSPSQLFDAGAAAAE